MKTELNSKDSTKAMPGSAPVSCSAVHKLDDGTEVLSDLTIETTRWILWRHAETKTLQLLIVQDENLVSVGIKNLQFMLTKVIPEYDTPNTKLTSDELKTQEQNEI